MLEPRQFTTTTLLVSSVALSLLTSALGCQQADAPVAYQPRHIKIEYAAKSSSAAELAERLAAPVEKRLSELPMVQRIESIVESDQVAIWLECDPHGQLDSQMRAVADELQLIDELPQQTGQPTLDVVPQGPILLVAIAQEPGREPEQEPSMDTLGEQSALVDELVPQFLRIPHVSRVSVWTGSKRRLEIEIAPEYLDAAGLSLDAIAETIETDLRRRKLRPTERFSARSLLEATPLLDAPSLIELLNQSSKSPTPALDDVVKLRVQTVPAPELDLAGEPLHDHLLVFAVHIESSDFANACSRDLDEQIASFSRTSDVRLTRELSELALDWKQILNASTKRIYPAGTVFRYDRSTDWKSFLEVLPAELSIEITGEEQAPLQEIAKEIASQLRKNSKLTDVTMTSANERRAVRFEIDQTQADFHGIDRSAIEEAMATVLSRQRKIRIPGAGPLTEIMVATPSAYLGVDQQIELIRRELIPGTTVAWQSVCRIVQATEAVSCRRASQQQSLGLFARIRRGADPERVLAEIHATLAPLEREIGQIGPDHRLHLQIR